MNSEIVEIIATRMMIASVARMNFIRDLLTVAVDGSVTRAQSPRATLADVDLQWPQAVYMLKDVATQRLGERSACVKIEEKMRDDKRSVHQYVSIGGEYFLFEIDARWAFQERIHRNKEAPSFQALARPIMRCTASLF